MNRPLPRVCIIGAGTSGVIAAKVFRERGVPFDCFEKGSGIGGLWRFNNDNGASTCYRSLHINTSKRIMELSDFPFPEHVSEYPAHWEILQYFEDYCEHFDVKRHIRFRTEVLHAERLEDGRWQVDVRGPNADGTGTRDERLHYDALVVANGHHWDPRMAEFPGHFDGVQFHSHHYIDQTDPHDLRGKRVVVLGVGNSAMDIACELGQGYREGRGPGKVFIAQRSGVWITPKVLGNVAQDSGVRHPMKRPGRLEHFRRRWVPRRLRHALFNFTATTWINLVTGNPRRVGLKAPQDAFTQRHPTVSQDIHSRLIHGDVQPKGNIRELAGDSVVFEDGSREPVDVIIHCTGYNITFPFFDREFLSAPDNDIALWHRMLRPDIPNLMFLALVQPLCAMMPIAELQSHFMAEYLSGEYLPPASDTMARELNEYHETMKAGYTPSPSHTIQIDCDEYTYLLYREWDAGRRRARAAGKPLTVKPLDSPAPA